jgi:DNA-directed RNA polymerase specialized sigma24 family protein
MSYDEIAVSTGLKRGAVGVILHEARQQLWATLPADWVKHQKVRCIRANT